MENDRKFENLMKNLKLQQPQLPNAGDLTDSILREIETSKKVQRIQFLPLIRACSAIAAIFLIGLFFIQNDEPAKTSPTHSSKTFTSITLSSGCLENGSKHGRLVELYACHLAQNSIKNKQLEMFQKQSNN